MHVLAYAHSPLTTLLSASAAPPPPPPHTFSAWGACRTQYGARCAAAGGRLRGGADRLASPEMPFASLPQNTCARPCHQNATGNKDQMVLKNQFPEA